MNWHKLIYDQIVPNHVADEPEKLKSILESSDLGPAGINAYIGNEYGTSGPGKRTYTALHLTILYKKVQSFQYLLSRRDIDVNVSTDDPHRICPLHFAVGRQDQTWGNLLLQHPDVDINQKSFTQESALCFACHHMFDTLLADPRLEPTLLNDYLQLLCGFGSYANEATPDRITSAVQRVRKLIVHPAIDLNAVDTGGRSVIFYVSRHQSAEFLKFYRQLFNDRRVTLSLRDNLGRTVKDYRESGRFGLNSAMIREAEKNRVRGCKRKVDILTKWTVDNQVIDEAVLYTYVLPYAVEDIISPVQEVLDSLDEDRLP